ncbi:MAG TPA: zinc ribbon domain-containing protein, partial [Mycobacterium sp.]|nr:zinc ribbon domain-containing protein [Mycobacterium sp.]
MTSLQPQTGPVPHACSLLSVPFWQGCRSGELRYQRCAACGRSNFPPTEHCRQC